MAKMIVDLTMSLDGFIAGPSDGPEHPLGLRDGERLFDWYTSAAPSGGLEARFAPEGPSVQVVEELFAESGAILSGRRTYDITHGWGGTFPIEGVKVVVVMTHRPPKDVPKGKTQFIFVTDGIEHAVAEAKSAAGDKNVGTCGASPAQACLAAGLADEIYVHVTPILLGAGVRLFDQLGDRSIKLEKLLVIDGPHVTHLRYRVIKDSPNAARHSHSP
jgi:dihydrofolate reductase